MEDCNSKCTKLATMFPFFSLRGGRKKRSFLWRVNRRKKLERDFSNGRESKGWEDGLPIALTVVHREKYSLISRTADFRRVVNHILPSASDAYARHFHILRGSIVARTVRVPARGLISSPCPSRMPLTFNARLMPRRILRLVLNQLTGKYFYPPIIVEKQRESWQVNRNDIAIINFHFTHVFLTLIKLFLLYLFAYIAFRFSTVPSVAGFNFKTRIIRL